MEQMRGIDTMKKKCVLAIYSFMLMVDI